MPEPIPFYKADINGSDLIVLDTCFVMDVLGLNNNAKRVEECEDFLTQIIINGGTAGITFLVREELYSVKLRNMLSNKLGHYNQETLKSYIKDNPKEYTEIMGQALRETDESISSVLKRPHFLDSYIELEKNGSELSQKAFELQNKYLFPGINDPKQLAIAMEWDAKYFATTDKDFTNVTDQSIGIVTDSKNYDKYYNK